MKGGEENMAEAVAVKQKIKKPKSIWQRAAENDRLQAALTVILPVLFGLLIFGLWQGGVLNTWFKTDTNTFPQPSKIWSITMDNLSPVWDNTVITMAVAFLGLVIGSLVGYLFAILAVFFPNFGWGGLTVIGAFASIPIVALAPVLNNWTRDVSKEASVRSFVSKTIVVILICAADMALNAYRGLTELPPYAEDLMKTFAAGKGKTFFKLRLPNSVPYIFIALKVSVPASIMTTVVSEYFAEYVAGVGRAIRENIVKAQYSAAWVYISAACLIGIVWYVVLMIVQSVVMKRYHQ